MNIDNYLPAICTGLIAGGIASTPRDCWRLSWRELR